MYLDFKMTISEKFVATLIFLLAALDVTLIVVKQPAIDWPGYAGGIGTAFLLFTVAWFYRHKRKVENIALAINAAGLFILFTIVASVFNYLLLPINRPTIDPFLVSIDRSLFGYDWPSWVAYAVQFPEVSSAMAVVYLSSLPQLILAVVFLGFTTRTKVLDIFMITTTVSAMVTILIWAIFPSFGAIGFFDLPLDIQADAQLVLTTQYGVELHRLLAEGPTLISPKDTLGLIGFPSFHTVMAVTSVYAFYQSKWTRMIAILVNLVMFPAILLHGGHNLMDVAGGLAVAALGFTFATAIVKKSCTGSGSIVQVI